MAKPRDNSGKVYPPASVCVAAWLRCGSAKKAAAEIGSTEHHVSKFGERYQLEKKEAERAAVEGDAPRDVAMEAAASRLESGDSAPLLASLENAPRRATGVAELARMCGVNRSRVWEWRQQAGADDPFPSGPPWEVDEVLAWRDRNIDAPDADGGGDELRDIKIQRARLDLEERRRKAAIESGQLVAMRDVRAALEARARGLTRAIEEFVRGKAGRFVGLASEHEAQLRLRTLLGTELPRLVAEQVRRHTSEHTQRLSVAPSEAQAEDAVNRETTDAH